MKYEFDAELQRTAEEISKLLFPHVDVLRVKCFRSYGSSSRNTLARCHTIGKLVQKALGIKAHYVIEFINENFEKCDENEKLRIIIHELMHIPKSFGGGFKHHDYMCDKNINFFYKKYVSMKNEGKRKWF